LSLELDTGGGSIVVPDSVLLQIATRAAEGVDGVRVRRRRAIDVKGRVVRLELAARGEEPLVALGEAVQEAVAGTLEAMCGLDVTVDVAFEERS
jgi:uncharacterized alkaline shock family protein YloU